MKLRVGMRVSFPAGYAKDHPRGARRVHGVVELWKHVPNANYVDVWVRLANGTVAVVPDLELNALKA